MLLTAIVLGLPLPLLPLQLLWINLTDTLLGLSLALEPKERDVMTRPPRKPKQPLLTRPLIMRTGLVSLIMWAADWVCFFGNCASSRPDSRRHAPWPSIASSWSYSYEEHAKCHF